MTTDFSKYLPQEGEATEDYLKRVSQPETTSTGRSVAPMVETPAVVRPEGGATVRVPAAQLDKVSDVGEVYNHLYENAGVSAENRGKLGAAYAGARGLAATSFAVKAPVGKVIPPAPRNVKRIVNQGGQKARITEKVMDPKFGGYDYRTGESQATTAASPNLRHFAEMHDSIEQLEAHVEHHMQQHIRAGGKAEDFDGIWSQLGKAYEKNSAAQDAHIAGNVLSRNSGKIKGAADHLTAAVTHVTNAATDLETITGGKYNKVNAGHIGMSNVVRNRYSLTEKQPEETAVLAALRGAGYSPKPEAYTDPDYKPISAQPRPQRPSLRPLEETQAEGAAKQAERVRITEATAPARERAMAADRAYFEARDAAEKAKAPTKPVPYDPSALMPKFEPLTPEQQAKHEENRGRLLESWKTADPKERGLPSPAFSGPVPKPVPMEVERASKMSASALAQFTAQQAAAKKATEERKARETADYEAQISMRQKREKIVADETQAMINNGNIAEAAMHHHNSTFATRNKARMKMVVYSPERYLNEQGFATPTTAKPTNRGVATNVEAKTDLKPAAPKSRKTRLEQAFSGIMEISDAPVIPAHRTPSAFTAPSPEAASEYEAKLAAQSAGKGRGR